MLNKYKAENAIAPSTMKHTFCSLEKSFSLRNKFVQERESVCVINICTEITSFLTPKSERAKSHSEVSKK